jgi:hypothetical protein
MVSEWQNRYERKGDNILSRRALDFTRQAHLVEPENNQILIC